MPYSGHNEDDLEINKQDITINLDDVDISTLTSSIFQLGNNLNNYLMQVFKEAYDKGLRSGYVLGHEKGYKEGKTKGHNEGKKEGFLQGKHQGKQEIKEKYSQLIEEEYVPECSEPNPMSHNIQHQTVNQHGNTVAHGGYVALGFNN